MVKEIAHSEKNVVVSRHKGQEDYFEVKDDGKIWSKWRNDNVNGGNWSASYCVGNTALAKPSAGVAAMRLADNQMAVFWVSQQGAIWMMNWVFPNWQNNEKRITASDNVVYDGTKFLVTSRHTDQIDVFWVNIDRTIWSNWWYAGCNNGNWAQPYCVMGHHPINTKARISEFDLDTHKMGLHWEDEQGDVWTQTWFWDTKNGIWKPPFIDDSEFIGLKKQTDEINDFLSGVEKQPNTKSHFLLLSGPSGVGKTESTLKICKKRGFEIREFQRAHPDDFLIGKLEARIQKYFEDACGANSPVCLFMDEMDAITPEYTGAPSAQGFDYTKIVTLIQMQIDKLTGKKVILIGATNYLTKMKDAIRNKAEKIHFYLPDIAVRHKLLDHGFRDYQLEDKAVVSKLAEATSEWSPRLIVNFKEKVRALATKENNSNPKLLKKNIFVEAFEASREELITDFNKKLEPAQVDLQPPRLLDEKSQDLLKDLVGFNPKIEEELKRVLDFLRNPEKYLHFGLNKHNLLLSGPPGTGKTEFARAIATHSNAMFISISAGGYKQPFAIDALKRLFALAKGYEKAVIFIDEIDAIIHEDSLAREVLQTEMDGFVKHKKVLVVIGATNYLEVIAAPALSRFFDPPLEFSLPNQEQRKKLFAKFIKNIADKQGKYTITLGDELKNNLENCCSILAEKSVGFSIRGIENFINEEISALIYEESMSKKTISLTLDRLQKGVDTFRDKKLKAQVRDQFKLSGSPYSFMSPAAKSFPTVSAPDVKQMSSNGLQDTVTTATALAAPTISQQNSQVNAINQQFRQQFFIQLEGKLSADRFIEICQHEKLDATKTVFIFPGNLSHHANTETLYGKKSGAGLAAVAGALGDLKYPSLSLPTTDMSIVAAGQTSLTARNAIADLWKALGFGLSLALPVRPKTIIKYFSHTFTNGLEPNFWGGVQATPNIHLADYYLRELKQLMIFSNEEDVALKQQFLKQLPQYFQKAYLDGEILRASGRSDWDVVPAEYAETLAFNPMFATAAAGTDDAKQVSASPKLPIFQP